MNRDPRDRRKVSPEFVAATQEVHAEIGQIGLTLIALVNEIAAIEAQSNDALSAVTAGMACAGPGHAIDPEVEAEFSRFYRKYREQAQALKYWADEMEEWLSVAKSGGLEEEVQIMGFRILTPARETYQIVAPKLAHLNLFRTMLAARGDMLAARDDIR